jgi:hypothetical protein
MHQYIFVLHKVRIFLNVTSIKKFGWGWAWWFMTIIPATQEAEVGGLPPKVSSRQKVQDCLKTN